VGIAANVADTDEIVALVEKIRKAQGEKLDILVANAGTTWGSRFEDAPEASSVKILDLNVRGVFNLVQRFLPLLEAAGTERDLGRVIIVSSTAGINVLHVGENGTIMYSVSKAAVHVSISHCFFNSSGC
jgi:NAD(P)-dependent dehydrogenase (short-subunit alcohol dehydrogenase family)